jgi:hypothetical protein
VADKTVIDSLYSGVTFSNPIGGSIYARDASGLAASNPNVVSVFGVSSVTFFNAVFGAVKAVFDTPQAMVSIDAAPVVFNETVFDSLNRPFIEFYNSSNQILDKKLWFGALPLAGQGSYQTLSYDAGSALIAYVIFSSQQSVSATPVYGQFDNLTFNPTSAAPVPLPAALPLFAGGLGLLGWMARRRRGQAAHA